MSTLPASETSPVFYGKPLTFNPARHMYFWGGQHVPSVTTIINRLGKENLIQWAANCAVDHIEARLINHLNFKVIPEDALRAARKAHVTIKEDAAGIGTRVHKYAQQVLQGQTPPEPLDGPAQQAVEAFWRWVEAHKIEPIAVERRVMSQTGMYAGTCDFVGMIDDQFSVLDFKTGNGVYDEAWWQTSGYAYALNEEHQHTPIAPAARNVSIIMPVRWIVHLNKTTGEMTPHRRDHVEHDADMAVWLSLVRLDQALRTARKHPQPSKKKAA